MTTTINLDALDIISFIGGTIMIVALLVGGFSRKKETVCIAGLIAFFSSITILPLMARTISLLGMYVREKGASLTAAETILTIASFYLAILICIHCMIESTEKAKNPFEKNMKKMARKGYYPVFNELKDYRPQLKNYHPDLPSEYHSSLPGNHRSPFEK